MPQGGQQLQPADARRWQDRCLFFYFLGCSKVTQSDAFWACCGVSWPRPKAGSVPKQPAGSRRGSPHCEFKFLRRFCQEAKMHRTWGRAGFPGPVGIWCIWPRPKAGSVATIDCRVDFGFDSLSTLLRTAVPLQTWLSPSCKRNSSKVNSRRSKAPPSDL